MLVGGAGGDYHDGGFGFDYASYEGGVVGVVASLSAPGRNRGDAAGDSYWSIEGLIGTGFHDQLTGDIGANSLHGGGGDDVLSGLLGNDLLDGGEGNDILNGGWGNDTFVFGKGSGRDTISDWQDGSSVRQRRDLAEGLEPVRPGDQLQRGGRDAEHHRHRRHAVHRWRAARNADRRGFCVLSGSDVMRRSYDARRS